MKISRIMAIAAAALVLVMPVMAETPEQTAAARKVIGDKLLKINPAYKISAFKPSGLEGFYKVQLANGPRLYVSRSGDHLFDGDLYQIGAGKLVNLSEQDTASERVALMKELNPKEMIIFAPKSPVKTKAVITVYTDVDCGYCQKLHQEVPELNAHGVEVRYMAFPRAGIGSPTYKKLVSAWCADNKQDALTKLKARQSIPEKTCNNPVAKQYDLGKRMGISGTPAILLQDGNLIPGYRPAPDLIKSLGL